MRRKRWACTRRLWRGFRYGVAHCTSSTRRPYLAAEPIDERALPALVDGLALPPPAVGLVRQPSGPSVGVVNRIREGGAGFRAARTSLAPACVVLSRLWNFSREKG